MISAPSKFRPACCCGRCFAPGGHMAPDYRCRDIAPVPVFEIVIDLRLALSLEYGFEHARVFGLCKFFDSLFLLWFAYALIPPRS